MLTRQYTDLVKIMMVIYEWLPLGQIGVTHRQAERGRHSTWLSPARFFHTPATRPRFPHLLNENLYPNHLSFPTVATFKMFLKLCQQLQSRI